MYWFSSSLYARYINFIFSFSFVIILRKSPNNFWINNYIKLFLSSIVAIRKLSTVRIWTTLGVCSAYDIIRPSSWAFAYLSQLPRLHWLVSSFLKIQSHQKAGKLPSYSVINIVFAVWEIARGASKCHQSFAPNVSADCLIKSWQCSMSCN